MIWYLLLSCGDQSFKQLPSLELGHFTDTKNHFMDDSVQIDEGLFFRKLRENGFDNIYGFAKIHLPVSKKENAFEIVMLSCSKDSVRQTLVVTIDPTYHSIIDIMAFDPAVLEIACIEPSKTMPSFIDIKLVDRIKISRQDTSIMQITQTGAIEEIGLCCDF